MRGRGATDRQGLTPRARVRPRRVDGVRLYVDNRTGSPPEPPFNDMNLLSSRRLLFAAAIFLAAASGCATFEKENRLRDLTQSVRLYENSIRWGDFSVAAGLLRRRDGGVTSATVNVPQEVRVTAFASKIIAVNDEVTEATVTTRFDYYLPDSGKVRTVSESDLWWFDPDTQQWYLDGELPNFKP